MKTSEERFHEPIEYLVSFGGGLGPNVWDREEIVKAHSIREAMDKADEMLKDTPGCLIFGIEQYDGV